MKGYNKILAAVLSLSVILMAVTYQPMHSEAFAGKVASYAAKKAAVWVAKETAEGSIEKMLKKKIDIGDPLFEKFISRVDYDLVQLDGKTFLLRNNLGATEKKALADQIGVVVDRMMYGQNAAWLSWVDWWSIGPMLLIGNIIYSEMTDENYSFINDVLMQALIDLGFLTIPEDNFIDTKTQKPVEPTPIPEPTSKPEENKNFGGTFNSSVINGTNYKNMPIQFYYAPYVPRITFVIEVVPNSSVTSITSSGLFGTFTFLAGKREYNVAQTSYTPLQLLVNGSVITLNSTLIRNFTTAKKTLYKGGTKLYEGTANDFSAYINPTDLTKMNRLVYSIDVSSIPYKYSISMRSTVSNVPTYSIMVTSEAKDNAMDLNEYISRVNHTTNGSTELVNAGFDVYWSLFTDKIISLPTPKPAPQLKDVKPTSPKEYVTGPVINNNPNTGKPTMAIPTTVIVQDPKSTPVNSDPKGGITITKPDGTPVTDPETELEPVTNQPEVKPNPNTGEPEIITQPNTPPEPATPPKTDPGTGEPGTGDPGNTTPPADPDDPDGQGKPSEVDWEKLKRIPYLFTTKFPFSLPWDAKRAAVAIFGDVPVVSKFEYTVEIPIGDGKPYKLDLSFPAIMDTFGNIFRTGLLIAFDIGLLYAVRKWFGGAS